MVASFAYAQCLRDGRHNPGHIIHKGQRYEKDSIREWLPEVRCHAQTQASFTDPGHAGESEQADI